MGQGIHIQVAFMDEVQEFLDNLADAPRDKIMYNVNKVQEVIRTMTCSKN